MPDHSSSSLSHLRDHHQFQDAAVTFAIDVSGSTTGSILLAEKKFVQSVSKLLSPRSQMMAKITPWDNRAYPTQSLSKLHTLESYGGTTPAVLLENSTSRAALKRSSLWFLLTDGIIEDRDREKFASQIAETGLHAATCIAVIFGDLISKPSDCNISVGVSVFAVAPNCLFLYYDVTSSNVVIMQSKGIFDTLLEKEIPIIDQHTTWDSFPTLPIQALSRVRIPPVRELSKDEIELQDSMVINFNDLWENRLDERQVNQIFSNDANLSSIVMTAQSRNESPRIQNWIQRQSIRVQDPLSQPRIDIDGNTQTTFREVIESFRAGTSGSEVLKQRLRQQHTRNMKGFLQSFESLNQSASVRATQIQQSTERAASCISYAPSMSPSARTPRFEALSTPQNRVLSAPMPPAAPQRGPNRTQYFAPYEETYTLVQSQITDPRLKGILYTPGFRSATGSFTGTCSLCGGINMTLVWLFRRGPSGNTPGFPLPKSLTRLAFPLAMGNFRETDILSSTLCCDPCSTYCISLNMSPIKTEAVSAALPMVRYAENKAPYEAVLQTAFSERFSREEASQVFLAVLLHALGDLEMAKGNHSTLYRAIKWACQDLIDHCTVPKGLSASFSLPWTPPIPHPLGQVLANAFRDIHSLTSPIIRYPLDGYMILHRAADLANIPQAARTMAVFNRYLFTLAEAYVTLIYSSKEPSGSDANPRTQVSKLLWTEPGADDGGGDVIMSSGDEVQSPTQPARSSAVTRRPQHFLPISSLRGSPLLDDRVYRKLAKCAGFQHLDSPASAWVGNATAVFLHVMVLMESNLPMGTPPWDYFNYVKNVPQIGVVSVAPEQMNAKQATDILGSILYGQN